jgi:acyl-CoA synthetase (AMP-forming)/AMP-acid ligase II
VEQNLADLFECVADTLPTRVALVADGRRLTYAALDERATRLAHGLAARGVGAGDHVGLHLFNCAEHLEAIFACFKLRAVPINMNYRYTQAELAHLAADADLVMVIRDPDLPAVSGVPALTIGAEYEAVLAAASSVRDFGPRSADDHYVLYTGGTTGLPKGVVWRQEDIFHAVLGGGNPGGAPITAADQIATTVVENRVQRLAPFLPAGDPGPDQFVALAIGPLMHASGQWTSLGALLAGSTLVLYTERHVDMTLVLDLIERERVVSMSLVGDASARPMVDALEHHPGRWDTASLRLLGSGGTILTSELKASLLAALPSVLVITEAIGSSECPVQATAVVTRDGAPPASLTFAARPETLVLDDDLRPVAPGSGAIGRLATRGRVPLGYYKDEARSATTFVELDGERWSMPGDMATVAADGTIALLGRGALCINTGGEKVYPEEVEAVVKAIPGVEDALVVGVPDPQWGQLVAAVVAGAVDLDTLQAHCRSRLAGYKVPRALRVVDAVVRSPAGKGDYAWARNRFDP